MMDALPRREALAILPALALPRLLRAEERRPRVGEVTAVSGRALAHFSTLPPRALSPAAEVLLDDMLATDPDARLACRLATGLEVRLGGNATLRVDRLALGGAARGPGRAAPGIALSSLAGPLLLDRPPPAESPRPPAAPAAVPISLDLPWARIGVRGTRFFAGPLAARYAVFCAHGRVEVTLRATGWQGVLEEGEGVDMPREGDPRAAPPPRITRWGAPRIAEALALFG